MASELARAKLARAARALNAGRALPSLILMTDENRLPEPEKAALALPKGAAIILRHRQPRARALLTQSLKPIATERALLLIISEDAELVDRMGADGLHLPEARAREAAHWKAVRPSWLITAAAHSAHGLTLAGCSGADAALLAPAFPTQSHIERASFGVPRLRLMIQRAPLPVYALGGVDDQTARRLAGSAFAGIAAIAGLIPD